MWDNQKVNKANSVVRRNDIYLADRKSKQVTNKQENLHHIKCPVPVDQLNHYSEENIGPKIFRVKKKVK